jgi:hypothetical protein
VSQLETDDRIAMKLAMRWYGWGSPVGLGLFILLIGVTVAVVRMAFR